MTGEGSGDDENIFINLDQIPQNVQTLWPCITIYTDNRQFDDVSGAYVRLVV